MFYYLIHNSPLGVGLEDGKRNVRTFIFGSLCYILLHALLHSRYGDQNETIVLLRNYICYVIFVDICAMGLIYKNYYGKSLFGEVSELVLGTKRNNKKIEPDGDDIISIGSKSLQEYYKTQYE